MISCENDKSLEKLEKDAVNKLGDKYNIKKINMKQPKVVIYGILEEDIPDNNKELLDKILLQNNLQNYDDIDLKVVNISQNKKKQKL